MLRLVNVRVDSVIRRVGFSNQMCGVADSVSPERACLICDRALIPTLASH